MVLEKDHKLKHFMNEKSVNKQDRQQHPQNPIRDVTDLTYSEILDTGFKIIPAHSKKGLSTLRHLWPYMWPKAQPRLKMRVIWALMFLIAAKVILIIIPYFFKWITDLLNVEIEAGSGIPILDTQSGGRVVLVIMALILAYNGARIMQAAFNQLRDALFAAVGQFAVRKLAYETFVHMHKLSLRFHLERRTGGLSRIIERGTKGIEAIVRFSILNTAPTVLEFALTAGALWVSFDWRYVAIVSLTVGLYIIFTVKASDWRITIRKQMNDSDTEANSRAIDSLLNFETVKYFGNETMEARRFDTSMALYEKAAVKTWISLGWLNFGQAVIFSLGMSAMMALSAWEVIVGDKTLGDFVLVNALLIQLSIPLNFIGFVYREVRQGLFDLEQMFDLLNVKQDIIDKPDAKNLIIHGASIRFDNVHFAYEPNRPILKGINLEVRPGQKLAIVGPSGAGKSTISRLLFRFYEVQAGAIEIDGQNISSVTQQSLRAAIGIVPQDTVLFNDTIAYNILYGCPTATQQDVEQAAKLAQIADFINTLPDGYQTLVGERGLKLSGGEKQRIALARTILKAPPILLLDEATSALDTATEREIQSALQQVSHGRTTLVIAHRLSTIIDADEILVLKAGKIVERGNHETLLEHGGLYASMWARQREAIEVEEKLRAIRANDDLGIVDRGTPAS